MAALSHREGTLHYWVAGLVSAFLLSGPVTAVTGKTWLGRKDPFLKRDELHNKVLHIYSGFLNHHHCPHSNFEYLLKIE